jgi:hypothetical protein
MIANDWPMTSHRRLGMIVEPYDDHSAEMVRLVRGVARALGVLLEMYEFEGHAPVLLDERHFKISDTTSRMTSFEFRRHPHIPHETTLRTLVSFLVFRFNMEDSDLILAFTLLEHIMREKRGLLHTYSVRPLLLVCCMIALKVSNDFQVTTRRCLRAVKDVFTTMSVQYASFVEYFLIDLIDWQLPRGTIYTTYSWALWQMGAAPPRLPGGIWQLDAVADSPPPRVFHAHEPTVPEEEEDDKL